MGWWRWAGAIVVWVLVGCAPTATVVEVPSPKARAQDHTVFGLESLDDYEKNAALGKGLDELKFVIPFFADEQRRHVRFLDANFYRYHDEWYWFALLSGRKVPAARRKPGKDHGFKTPRDATHWALGQEKLPLGLEVVEGDRLYAPEFYKLALGKRPHTYGLGSILRVPAAQGGEETWAFKLEYSDDIKLSHLEIYLEALQGAVPPAIADKLVFVARSPHQHQLVADLRAQGHELASRTREFSDFVTPGAIEVYHPSLTAGYLRFVDAGDLETLSSSREDILVLPHVPDELPLGAGLITAVPQTPLSHINLLAQNRGIPNVHLGGAMENLQLRQLARDEMPVVMSTEEGKFVIRALDQGVYALWKKMTRPTTRVLPPANPELLPYVRDLRKEDLVRVEELRRDVGGKAAGYVSLLAGGANVPRPALALSTRPFLEHMQRIYPTAFPALADAAFLGSSQVRLLALEGADEFRARVGDREADRFLSEFHRAHPSGALADLVQSGGLRRVIRDLPMEPQVLQHITERLRARFSELAPTQGLRFRSSSNVEDIEGFNGAGLYTSTTGFLEPNAAVRLKDRKKSVEYAIKRTWSSFFSFSAYEERLSEGIDPLSGGMGVLVHPRFDDPHEEANGVLTLRIGAADVVGLERYVAVVNAQKGAVSVTNAESGVTPEVVQLQSTDGRAMAAELKARASGSSGRVLREEQLATLLRESVSVGEAWLAQANRGVPGPRQRRGGVLDFEFRVMSSAWPARRGSQQPGRGSQVILKQVRPLEPGLFQAATQLSEEPIPKELLVRAARIERRSCTSKDLKVDLLELWAKKGTAHNFGYQERPFLAEVTLNSENSEFLAQPLMLTHLELKGASAEGAAQAFSVSLPAGERVRSIELRQGTLRVTLPDGRVLRQSANCETVPLLDHPERLLREALVEQ